MRARRFLAAVAIAALPALAADAPAWPPPDDVQARMHELQQVIIARDSTPAQRDAARAELSNLLKSPSGHGKATPGEKPVHVAPRAATDPYPTIVAPLIPAIPTPPSAGNGVARLEVTQPSRPFLIPVPGAAGRIAIDPRTGDILRETPAGFLDPKTGQIHPR